MTYSQVAAWFFSANRSRSGAARSFERAGDHMLSPGPAGEGRLTANDLRTALRNLDVAEAEPHPGAAGESEDEDIAGHPFSSGRPD